MSAPTASQSSHPVLRVALAMLVIATIGACSKGATTSQAPATPVSSPVATESATPTDRRSGSVVIVGRSVTMSEPAVAEALFIDDGVVAAVGTRDDVLALAGASVPVIDIGANVAYPGFIDAHAHWIGDREYYGAPTAAAAMDAALARGWTSISEQWVNRERLRELEELAASGELSLRVDAYLTLNEPHEGGEKFGDWYVDREPGPVGDRLRVQGLKMHLDWAWGTVFHFDAAELRRIVGRAHDAGWQVSIHTVSTEAHELVLDAYEAALGPTGPNPLHHRIEHAIQVSDAQLARTAAMDVSVVIHPDGAAADFVLDPAFFDSFGPQTGEDLAWLVRYRDFVDAGIHVAAATDTPWVFPDLVLTDDIGRPVDQIAGGMDGRGRANPEIPEWLLEQLLTAEDGLRAVTVDAARALNDEARRGHLAVGTLGDVTILTGDVLGATPDEIRAMKVIATIVGGQMVHCGDPRICETS